MTSIEQCWRRCHSKRPASRRNVVPGYGARAATSKDGRRVRDKGDSAWSGFGFFVASAHHPLTAAEDVIHLVSAGAAEFHKIRVHAIHCPKISW